MSTGTARYMVYTTRSKFLLDTCFTLMIAASLAGCDEGSLGAVETETSSSTGFETTGGEDTETSTSGETTSETSSSETSTGESSTSGSETGDPTATTGSPATCEVTGDFTCSDGVDCDGDSCGALDSYFDEDGCIRPTCRRNSECGEGEFCYYDELYGGCASSAWSCFDEGGSCECGGAADCGGAYCVPTDRLPGGAVAGPTIGSIEDSCAPDDGPALVIRLGLEGDTCGAMAEGGPYVEMILYADDPSVYSGFTLDGELQQGGGAVQLISEDGGMTPMGDATGAVRLHNWGEETIEGDYEVSLEGGATYVGSFSVPYCETGIVCG